MFKDVTDEMWSEFNTQAEQKLTDMENSRSHLSHCSSLSYDHRVLNYQPSLITDPVRIKQIANLHYNYCWLTSYEMSHASGYDIAMAKHLYTRRVYQ